MSSIDSLLDRLSLRKENDFSHIYKLVDDDINLILYCYINAISSVIPFLKNLDSKHVLVALFNFEESEIYEYIRRRVVSHEDIDLYNIMPLIDEYIEKLFE